MAEISSISIREDLLIWTEITKEENTLNIHRAAFEKLPIPINHKTLTEKKTVTRLSAFLGDLARKNSFQQTKIRLGIPGHFVIIRKIIPDSFIPEDKHQELIGYELEKLWEEPVTNFRIYLPTEHNPGRETKEILVVAVRKTVLDFFDTIFEKAQLELDSVSPSCFGIEELFRLVFPHPTGQFLLLGWHRRGFEAIISENQNFQNYFFRSYTKNLDPIERVTEFDLANGFSNLLFDIQQPSSLENPLYDLQTIYNFGYYFKPEWLDFMRSRIQIPSTLFTLDSSAGINLTTEDKQVSAENFYQYVESISNIF